MRTKNCLGVLRDAVTLSALLIVIPAVCLAQQGDRFEPSPAMLQATPSIGVDPQLALQPPCGKETIPSYPGLDESAIVKSWSRV